MRSCLRACAQDVAIVGRHNRTLAIAAGDKLRVYRIYADDALPLLRTFGGSGAGPGPKVPSLIASTAWARMSSAHACDNVSMPLLYFVVVTALLLAEMLC